MGSIICPRRCNFGTTALIAAPAALAHNTDFGPTLDVAVGECMGYYKVKYVYIGRAISGHDWVVAFIYANPWMLRRMTYRGGKCRFKILGEKY